MDNIHIMLSIIFQSFHKKPSGLFLGISFFLDALFLGGLREEDKGLCRGAYTL